MLTYKKMSLFDAPKGSILVHSCNAQGVWGSGIAKDFKEKYPRSFKEYNKICIDELEFNSSKDNNALIGDALICDQENKKFVACLITSFDYGKNRDNPDEILLQTTLALDSLLKHSFFYGEDLENKKFYSNKFNSGMFKVPWEDTEKILKYFVDRYNLNWVVCEV